MTARPSRLRARVTHAWRPALFLLLLAAGLASPALRAAQPPPTVVQVSASLHILVRLSDGSVVGLGENRSGQLARPPDIRRFLAAARIELPAKAVQVVAEDGSSFALLDDGTVWAWGRGYERQLGVDISGTERFTPAAVPGLTDVKELAVTGKTAMAVLKDGTVRMWGEVPAVIRGTRPGYPGVSPPMPVPGLEHVTHVTGGSPYGFALTDNGRVLAWGGNGRGYLGLGRATSEAVPPTELSTLREVVSIETGASATIAVTRDGRVWTWGSNQQANLGNGEHSDVADDAQLLPQPVTGITDAVEVKTGSYGRHVIVRRKNGTLIGWGNSDWGQLGAGIAGDFQPKPTPIKLPGVEAYWLGGNFSFARTTDGALWFWGEESAARRLVAATGNQRVPAKVPPEKYLPAAPQ